GRRPVLIISQWGTLFAWLIFAGSYFVPNSTILFNAFPLYVIALSRIVDGITGGNISVSIAYLADITTKEERTRIYGIMGVIIGICMMIGSVIGGITNSFSI